MSEYQCYEFFALDRPLTTKEMGELRTLSTRAEISPSRFWNEYQWGDLKADPARLLARYFDAFLYFANWGSHRFMLRLPITRIDPPSLSAYFPGGPAKLTKSKRQVVVDLWSDSEEPEDDWFERGRLGALVPLRAALLEGDMSAAYLSWLLAVQAEEVSGSDKEPPVPSGLRKPNGPLVALMRFLRIDQNLVAAAAENCSESDINGKALRRWLLSLPRQEKDRWLTKAVDDPTLPIGTDLRAAFRRQRPPSRQKPRTVSRLLARAEELRLEREKTEAKRAARARRQAEVVRKRHLAALNGKGAKAWGHLEQLVESRQYDDAVRLTVDLRDAAHATGKADAFDKRLAVLKKKHARRRGYLNALKRQLREPST